MPCSLLWPTTIAHLQPCPRLDRGQSGQWRSQAHLPAWLWGKNKDGQWKVLDTNSASDADVWMAYTLIEAGRLWKSPGYANLGRAMLAMIAKNEVVNLPDFGPMLMPGPAGFQQGKAGRSIPATCHYFSSSGLLMWIPPVPGRRLLSAFPSC